MLVTILPTPSQSVTGASHGLAEGGRAESLQMLLILTQGVTNTTNRLDQARLAIRFQLGAQVANVDFDNVTLAAKVILTDMFKDLLS